jgi:hypothetical protein
MGSEFRAAAEAELLNPALGLLRLNEQSIERSRWRGS